MRLFNLLKVWASCRQDTGGTGVFKAVGKTAENQETTRLSPEHRNSALSPGRRFT
jgi:hypothetical protein